jgi:hypothetical protein
MSPRGAKRNPLSPRRIEMSMKTFTLEEAESLLPILESLLRTSIEGKAKIESLEEALTELKSRIFLAGGMTVNVVEAARQRAIYDKTVQQVRDAVAEIHSIGVQVKDLDIGLLDFPCEVENEIVLLCWKYGEKGITHYHGLEDGFAGRKPIDERITRNRKDPQ